MPIEWANMRPFRIPSRRERITTAVIRWGLVALIIGMSVNFDLNGKFISLTIPFKTILIISLGIICEITLEIVESYFRDFLIKRRIKKQGNIICKTCNGNGWTPKSSRYWFLRIHKRNHTSGTCVRCRGRGYVDWIQNVVGGSKGFSNDNVESGPAMSGGSSSSV